jgi:hypothetical protein
MNLASHVEEFRSLFGRSWPAIFDWASSSKFLSLERGAALINKASVIPSSLTLGEEVYDGWNVATLSGPELERLIRGSDWQWSYYVSSLTVSRWGVTADQAVGRSVRRLLNKVKDQGVNSVQIDSIKLRKIFWLSHATVKLGSRNLQRGPFLRPLDPRHRYRPPGRG